MLLASVLTFCREPNRASTHTGEEAAHFLRGHVSAEELFESEENFLGGECFPKLKHLATSCEARIISAQEAADGSKFCIEAPSYPGFPTESEL